MHVLYTSIDIQYIYLISFHQCSLLFKWLQGEFCFENDTLIEGGRKTCLNNGKGYKEVRQYQTDCHLLRFYFVTRCYSTYMESILSDLSKDPQPDVVIMNSCLWDISRYILVFTVTNLLYVDPHLDDVTFFILLFFIIWFKYNCSVSFNDQKHTGNQVLYWWE